MRSICLYFQVHQPLRLRTYRFFDMGRDHHYYDDYQNRYIIKRVAEKSYLPANKVMLDLIKEYGSAFKVSYSISGIALQQLEEYAPQVIDSFRELAKTGCVEFLTETNSHSLASLKSVDEFRHQVEKHSAKIEKLFGVKPVTFRNTELIYSDEIGAQVADMGFETMLTEGAKHVLGWKSPNYLYCNAINPRLKLLLRNFTLSDDIAFRFSQQSWGEWPLTAEKFVRWLNEIDKNEEVVNIFADYETFGEHQWAETGIFDFLRSLPKTVFENSDFKFKTPAEVSKELQPVSAVHVPYPISWADEERDLTAWLGNDLQDDAFNNLYALEPLVKGSEDPELLKDWDFLQTSDHFYYMCTKWFSDGDVHKYFNPYPGPYEAYINFMNVVSDFTIRVNEDARKRGADPAEIMQKLADKQKEIIKEVSKTVKEKVSKTARKGIEAAGKTSKQAKKKVKEVTKDVDFEALSEISKTRMKKLVREVNSEDIAKALKGAKEDLQEFVQDNMGVQARKKYEEISANLKKVTQRDIKDSQKRILNQFKELFK